MTNGEHLEKILEKAFEKVHNSKITLVISFILMVIFYFFGIKYDNMILIFFGAIQIGYITYSISGYIRKWLNSEYKEKNPKQES